MNNSKALKQKSEIKKKTSTVTPRIRRRAIYVWLNIQPDDIWIRVRQGDTIRKALREANIKLEGDCGGLGKCGKCKVKILSPVDEPTEDEIELLDNVELEQGIRLACRTKVIHDLAILADESGAEPEYFQVLTTSHAVGVRFIPESELDPLVNKKLIILPPEIQNEGHSDLDQIKLVLGIEYHNLEASLRCLRTLPQKLEESNYHGTVVLHDDYLMEWQNWEELHRHYGLVFDIGTSTLVGKLISLVDGSEIAVASCLNSQSKYGSDVISRLQYLKEHPRILQVMQYLISQDLSQLTELLLRTAELETDDIFLAIVAGNPTMQHLLLGLPPFGIAEAPFLPVLTDGIVVKSADVGLKLHPEAKLYVMPMKSGYIGGDLISNILTSGVVEQEEIILGLDLGTNGEIFLGNSKRLLTCSAAAGPALEGARISFGMIAKAGAIEGVRLEDGKLQYRVIGNIKPKGICGSGLVDLVAELLHCRIVNQEGLIRRSRRKLAGELNSRLVKKRAGSYSFLVATPEESYDQKPIYLTQKDVREVQLAKGAIAAGIKTLMNQMGIEAKDIYRVYLSGALGNYIDPLSAIRIGLLPHFNPRIIESLGNAASRGASMAMLSKKYWQLANELIDFIEHIELSYHPDFNEYFVEYLDFPKGDLW